MARKTSPSNIFTPEMGKCYLHLTERRGVITWGSGKASSERGAIGAHIGKY